MPSSCFLPAFGPGCCSLPAFAYPLRPARGRAACHSALLSCLPFSLSSPVTARGAEGRVAQTSPRICHVNSAEQTRVASSVASASHWAGEMDASGSGAMRWRPLRVGLRQASHWRHALCSCRATKLVEKRREVRKTKGGLSAPMRCESEAAPGSTLEICTVFMQGMGKRGASIEREISEGLRAPHAMQQPWSRQRGRRHRASNACRRGSALDDAMGVQRALVGVTKEGGLAV